MSKGFSASAKSYAKNVISHTKLVVTRKETVGEALQDLRRDSKKLKAMVVEVDVSGPHGKAVQLVKNGRRKYNAQDYETAEKCFRGAILEDPDYTLAMTYLGHALYKLGRSAEAAAVWQRASSMDPGSYAGKKARQKLGHLQKRNEDLVSDLDERLS
jgi:tetratricopeptide (TPR) repeat protein